MASIVTRGKSYSVVYMDTVDGARKQKWETYPTLEKAKIRVEQINLCTRQKKSAGDASDRNGRAVDGGLYSTLWYFKMVVFNLSSKLWPHSALHPTTAWFYEAYRTNTPSSSRTIPVFAHPSPN